MGTIELVNQAGMIGGSDDVIREGQPYVLVREEGLRERRCSRGGMAQQLCEDERVL